MTEKGNGYSVQFDPDAWAALMKLPRDVQERIIRATEGLEVNPRPSGVKKLSGNKNIYRIRIGDYRAMYEVRDAVLIVLIVKVGKRGDVYRTS